MKGKLATAGFPVSLLAPESGAQGSQGSLGPQGSEWSGVVHATLTYEIRHRADRGSVEATLAGDVRASALNVGLKLGGAGAGGEGELGPARLGSRLEWLGVDALAAARADRGSRSGGDCRFANLASSLSTAKRCSRCNDSGPERGPALGWQPRLGRGGASRWLAQCARGCHRGPRRSGDSHGWATRRRHDYESRPDFV